MVKKVIIESDESSTEEVVAPVKKVARKSPKKTARKSPKKVSSTQKAVCKEILKEAEACYSDNLLTKSDLVKLIGKTASPSKAKASKKAKKDPNVPKRALSGYMFFVKANRDIIVKKLGSKLEGKDNKEKIGIVGKAMGAEWNKIKGTSEAKKYEAQAVKDKSRYAEAMASYDPAWKPAKAKKAPMSPKKAKKALAKPENEGLRNFLARQKKGEDEEEYVKEFVAKKAKKSKK